MSIKKSSIQQALIEAREIEKSAIDNAKKALEEELAPKIKQVANDVLKELEKEALKEDITIKISTDGEEVIETPEITNSEEEIKTSDSAEELEPEENINTEDDIMEDIFEIEGLGEADAALPAETPAPAPAEVPTEPVADVAPTTAPEEAPSIETVNQKLDDVLAKLDAISNEEAAEASEEGEGDVTIVDDEEETAPVAAETPAPAPAPAPTPALQEDEFELDIDTDNVDEVVYEMEDDGAVDEVVYEFEEDDDDDLGELNSDSIMEMFNELQETDEIEIVDEDAMEENTVEEMQGVGHNLKHSNRLGKLPRQGVNRKELNESIEKVKAQYGSENDELKKENESLKQTIKEYKESFIVIRKQINEVQIFNAKLAYANKLFTNGGLTNDEKIKIAEDFDKVETIEEAKKLYNTFLNEMNVSKSPKTTPVDKLKSASPSVVKSSNSQTLFESDEMRRMKRLAGISKKSEE